MLETVLFVDDDLSLLQGLKRMLRVKRSCWDIEFASSAYEAIKLMNIKCFDIVVADMQMPGMNGAELLREVARICPNSIRIILSGQADLPAIMQSISSTHQYITKPCEPENLINTLDQTISLRKLIKNPNLESFISNLTTIPSESILYDQVLNLLQSANPEEKKIAELIASDIGMSVKILQLVNSSFFGSKRTVFNIYEAITILGLDLLRNLILNFNIFEKADDCLLGDLNISELNANAVTIGNYAVKIALIEGLEPKEVAMFPTTGLLHDIGKIVLAMFDQKKYSEIISLDFEDKNWLSKEKEYFGATHAEVGGYLLGLWGLPIEIVYASSQHITEDNLRDKNINHKFSILDALQAARAFAEVYKKSDEEKLENTNFTQRMNEIYQAFNKH